MRNLLFLTGRIRSKEKDLLKKADWQRFTEADSLAGWLKQLKDTVYSESADQASTYEEFETALNKHCFQLKQDLFSVQKFPFESLLWQKYDYHNIKILLKIRLGHKDLRKYLIPSGEIPINILEDYLMKDEKVDLSLNTLLILRQAQEIYAKSQDFSAMDIFLDKIYFEEILKAAKPWGTEVAGFFKTQIDLANYKIWWYLKKNEKAKVEYLSGGSIPQRYFETAQEASQEQMLAKVFPGKRIDNLEDAFLQKEMDELLSQRIYLKRYPNQGILPILVFFRAKEMEIKNLKIFYLRQAKNLKRLSSFLRSNYA